MPIYFSLIVDLRFFSSKASGGGAGGVYPLWPLIDFKNKLLTRYLADVVYSYGRLAPHLD
jgi:hypothetical protein